VNTPENFNTASRSAHAGDGVDWDARYVSGDTPWDKGDAHPALRHWLEKTPLTGRILVPGCGAGHDVRALAARGASAVYGIDIAPSALQLARSFPKTGNETYQEGDFLTGCAVEPGAFDAIFEHTCFCAIPPERRRDYVMATHEALRPGGLLLAVFFTNPENPDPDMPPFRCNLGEIELLFGEKFEMLDVNTTAPTFDERTGRETLCLMRKKSPMQVSTA